MKKKVSEICDVLYGENNVCCEPSKDDIDRAVKKNDLEIRWFQRDINLIDGECKLAENRYDCMRQYHARRIAFFVVNKWTNPIVLNREWRIKDGLHRLKAARYLGIEVVDIEIE